jgi:hypothetical protein
VSEIVTAIATSHSPLLTLPSELWLPYSSRDRHNPDLYDETGAHVTFDELAERNGDRYGALINEQHFVERASACQAALDRLAAHLEAARPDAVVIVGDDQTELFDSTNQPVIAIFHGDRFEMATGEHMPDNEIGTAMRDGYAMRPSTAFASNRSLARHLIAGLLERDVDVAASDGAPAGRGFGHAYGFVARRLSARLDVPIVPILLNTYYPPNQPTPGRCYRIGQALGAAIDDAPDDVRVALVASGGLSHFVVDTALDGLVLDAIVANDSATLSAIAPVQLQAGSSEIRNWITVAGAMAGRSVAWRTYVPCIRSVAGTGMGMGFLAWT